jgi:hypothetical protein
VQRGAVYLRIKSDDTQVEVTPSETDGRGKFASIEAAKIQLLPEPERIGQVIFGAIPRCRTKSRLS